MNILIIPEAALKSNDNYFISYICNFYSFLQFLQFHLLAFIDYKLDIEPVVIARADMR